MSYSVRLEGARFAEEALPSLWAETLPAHGDLRGKARWFYRDAPAGEGCVFVLAPAGGAREVLGCAGVGARAFAAGDARLRAGLLADFAIVKAHRTVLPALTVQREVRAFVTRDLDLAYGYPNDAAVGVFKRLGYVVLGHVERWVRVLRVAPYAARGPARPAARLGARVVDPALAAFDMARAAVARGRLALELPAALDARFDALWERSRGAFGVVGDRDAATLRWRFLARPDAPCEVAALVDRRSGALEAYAVVVAEGRAARIADAFGPSTAAVARMIAALLPALRARGFDSASFAFFGASAVRDALFGLGFALREASRTVILDVGDRCPVPRATLLDRERWFLTELDEDNP